MKLGLIRKRNMTSVLCLGLAGPFLCAGSLQAADVTFEPFVEGKETFTDNAFSSGAGQRQVDFITSTTAGFDFEEESKRSRADVSYSFSRDTYADNSELNGTRHSLLSDGELELVEDWLSIKANAAITEQNITKVGDVTASNRTAGANQTRIINTGIGPVVEHSFGEFAGTSLSYKYSVVDFKKTDAGSSITQPSQTTLQNVDWRLVSGPDFDKFSWELKSSYKGTEREGTSTTTGSRSRTTNAEVKLGYDITRSVALTGKVGHDDNNADSVSDDRNGIYYLMGAELSLADRLKGEVLVGDRYGTTTVEADLKYTPSERTTVSLAWGTKVQSQQQEIASNNRLSDDGDLIDPNALVLEFQDTTAKTETIKLNFNHQRSERTTFKAGLTAQSREVTGTNEEMTATVDAGVTYLLSHRLKSGLDLSYTDKIKTRTDNTGQSSFSLGGTLEYSHNSSLTSMLEYDYLVRREDADTDVRENVLSVKLRKTF